MRLAHADLPPAVANRLAVEKAAESKDPESLYDRVSRMRARWLKRIMYGSGASSSQRCLAYAVFDHLNCVTLDSWPGQLRLAELLGFDSVKSIQRAANGLEDKGFLRIKRFRRSSYRYAPVFLPSDDDNSVRKDGHSWDVEADRSVRESLLPIQLTTPTPTAAEKRLRRPGSIGSPYSNRNRGSHELELAAMLGPDGMEILSQLAKLDDGHVDRLCRAHAAGAVGERELSAARLAAKHAS